MTDKVRSLSFIFSSIYSAPNAHDPTFSFFSEKVTLSEILDCRLHIQIPEIKL